MRMLTEHWPMRAELDGARKDMLDIHKNPLLCSILNSCETLKALDEKNTLPLAHLAKAKGLMFFTADKASGQNRLHGSCPCMHWRAHGH